MTAISNTGLRISRIQIENYKKLDFLEIEFSRPLMAGDMDVLVLGSKNGGGKTSVLECCALVLLLAFSGSNSGLFSIRLMEIAHSLIKAGQEKALITASFEKGEICQQVCLIIEKKRITIKSLDKITTLMDDDAIFESDIEEHAFNCIFANSGEPLILPPLLHFNSYRQIHTSNPELGEITGHQSIGIVQKAGRVSRHANLHSTDQNPNVQSYEQQVSPSISIGSFKIEVLRSLMGQASLFEGVDKSESEKVLSQLNGLMQRYCGGRIESLRPLPDNTLDIRIKPTTGDESYSFDGLSSGQKEIIATLFLIWKYSQTQPQIVLIDEPELHLNAEWHVDLVTQLHKLAPNNQYIMATHSEEIFRSVDESQRALLVAEEHEGV